MFWNPHERRSRVPRDSFSLVLAYVVSRRGVSEISEYFFRNAAEVIDQVAREDGKTLKRIEI